MPDHRTGGVYAEWHRDVRHPYVIMLNRMIDELNRIPRWSNTILQSDIITLIKLCESFGVEYDKDALHDPVMFEITKGKIQKKIKEIIEKELKPEDPYIKMLDRIRVDETDARNIIEQGRENEEE